MYDKELIYKDNFSREEITGMLSVKSPAEQEILRNAAYDVMEKHIGTKVYLRGLVEFSNYCINDCYYCGIRKSNDKTGRYFLKMEDIIETAQWCAQAGYGSFVLQSGERRDEKFISFVEEAVIRIKDETKSESLPQGLGITLCVGEQDHDTYKRFYNAGAHRYLLRIETTNPELYKKIHPQDMSLERRKECLNILKDIGFQTGTGVMIGFPGQTLNDLAEDILFFRDMNIDMIGMGPYIVHADTPMCVYSHDMAALKDDVYNLALKMIAVTRLVLKDVNIASTTALQAMQPQGREEGLSYGANVIMPLMTPVTVRQNYRLYEGKPCLEDSTDDCYFCIKNRVESLGRKIAYNEWGDPKHFFSRTDKL